MEKRSTSARLTQPMRALAVVLIAAGCGGGGGGTPPPPAELQTVVIPSPRVVTQGATGVLLRVAGQNFRDGGQLAVSGSGVTATETTIVSETEATARLAVDDDAPFGLRDVLYFAYPGAPGPESTLADAIQVHAPDPEPDALAPGVVTQGDQGVTLTLTGMHFREGGEVSLGAGVQVTDNTWISEEEFEVTIDVSEDADLGLHALVFTQPVAGGGAARTLFDALQVNAPPPTFTSVTPAVLKQGEQAVVLTVEGTGFRAGGRILVGGTELQVGPTTVVSKTRAQAEVTVPDDAVIGPRLIGFAQPAEGGGAQATDADGLAVHYPDPQVTSLSPTTLKQGSSATTVTVKGTGFRTGGTLSVSGSGLTLTNMSIASATEATVDIAVADTAAVGARNLTYTQPSAGGGAAGTGTGLLTIHYPDPTVTSISPATLKQGSSATTVTVKGTGFRSGGTLAVSGTGLTLGSTQVVSATEAKVDVTVADTATIGLRSVTYTQPSNGGGAVGTGTDLLTIDYPDPTVTSISPATLKQGASATTVTVKGTGFRSGGTLTVSGTGLTLGSTQVVSATEAKVDVTVADTATIGKRNVVFTQPSDGGGAAGTGTDLLTIHYPDPTVTSVTPTTISQASSTQMTVTGTNFRSGGTLSTSGTGVTLSEATFVSDTSFKVTVEVASTATLGARDVTYTQPSAGGGASATLTKAYEIVLQPTISPSQWVAGHARIPVGIAGAGFDTGTTVSVSGSGVTVHSTTRVSSTSLVVELTIAPDATLGTRDLTITPGDTSKSAETFQDAVGVIPAPPTVTGFTPLTMAQGASGVSVTVYGTNFRSGAAVTSGSGITVKSVSVVSAEAITATIDVSSSATTGTRDVTVAHSESEGGAASTREAAFRVTSSSPTVTAVAPAAIGRTGSGGPTRSVPVKVTGTNFASSATLAVTKSSGSGVSVVSASVASDTVLEAVLSITGTASTGKWDLKVTNPGGAGNSGTTGNSLLDIKSESTLTVNNVAPASGTAHGGNRVTIYGAGFAAQAVVDFGKVRASGTQTIDANTIVTIVPAPTSASSTAPTDVDVVVTNSSGSSATLTKGYRYTADDTPFRIVASIPAQGATGVPKNLVSAAVLLSGPADTTTGPYGTTQGKNCSWWESAGSYVSNGYRAFGPAGRWLVYSRTGGGNLPINSQGLYVLETPTALLSIGGVPLTPTRLSSLTAFDYHTFTISSSATDTTAPKLSTIQPSNQATGVGTTTRVVLTMDEPIDPQTVRTTTITFKQGSTTVPAAISLGADLKTITITPHAELATSTTYTTAVTGSVKDLCGNAFSSTSYTFTTNSGTDTTAPTIDDVVIEALPPDMDGSGTYVNSSGSGGNAFDVFLPRGGWLVTAYYSDEGGAGIDESSFSAKASVAVGSTSANTELASGFTVTSTQATWRIPAQGFATGDNATLTFKISDLASTPNVSSSKAITIDVFNLASSAYYGGDYDPFDKRDTWVLRFDLDAYKANYSTSTNPPQQGATTSVSSNGLLDVDESLRLVGLNSGNMTTAAAATVNGPYRGTNAIARAMFMHWTRAFLRARYGIGPDGTRYADSVNIEFLLPGEQGSLSSMPTYSSAQTNNSSKAFSEISIGGTPGAESNAYTGGGTLGLSWADSRNLYHEADLNAGASTNLGVFLLSMMKYQVNGGGYFYTVVSSKLVTVHGGTPVGEHASDDDVLAGSFDRTTSTNTTHNARYDAIMDAIQVVALYTSSVLAHEIGHAVGLVEDGAPKTGLFGGAHYNNTFTEATSVATNTSWHLDYLGNDVMGASLSFDDAAQSGADFQRFSPMNRAYLLRRLGYDEGK